MLPGALISQFYIKPGKVGTVNRTSKMLPSRIINLEEVFHKYSDRV